MGNEINGNTQSATFRSISFLAKNVRQAPAAIAQTIQDVHQPGKVLDSASHQINILRKMASKGIRGWSASKSSPRIEKAQNLNGNNSRVVAKKAAYMFKFSNLIEWPHENGKGDFNMGVIDDPKMVNAMKKLEGKMIRGQRVRIVKVQTPDDLKKLDVKMLYINPNSKRREAFNQHIQASDSSHTLAVTSGGISKKGEGWGNGIGLVQVKNRLRFRINTDEVRRRGLKISPRLVKVASVLVVDHRPGSK